MTAVWVLCVVGIAFIVVPIFLYKASKGKKAVFKKIMNFGIPCGIIACLPMIYYIYADIRYDAGNFTLNDKLYLAAENKNLNAAKRFIGEGADPWGENRYDLPAVYRAVMLDDTDMLSFFLEKGDDPNYTCGETITLLSVAAKNQCAENVRILLDAGADPDYLPDYYVPALHYAAQNDSGYNAELVEMLVNAGADPSSTALVEGKVMLPYRYYYDRRKLDDDITEQEEQDYEKIKDMLYRPYIDWLVDKMTSENGQDAEALYGEEFF